MPEDNHELRESNETPVPEWLEKLQNESWQAELLISGGALVGLFNAYGFIDKTANYLTYYTDIGAESINALSSASGLTVFILIVGFISHLVLRGFWIGLIGLNSAFPGGINSTKLSFKGRFTNFFKEEKNNSLIIRLDKICGLIFALTFVALFSFTGIILFSQVIAILQNVFPSESEVGPLIYFLIAGVFIVVIVAGILTFIDFVTGGWIKKIKWFAPVYYPIHWVMSIITLSFLYRRLYYTIVSNIRGFYLILILCIPIAIVFLLSVFSERYSGLANFGNRNAGYEPEFQTSFLSIKNERVEGTEIEVSILHLVRLERKAFEEWSKKNGNSKAKFFSQLSDRNQADILKNLYQIRIDSVNLRDSGDWLISSQNDGGSFMSLKWVKLVKFIDVHSLENGNHQLKVKINLQSNDIDGFKINQRAGYQGILNFIVHRPKQPDNIPGED